MVGFLLHGVYRLVYPAAGKKATAGFTKIPSHELKTPLAGIRLLTDSILQTDDMNAETTREFVADIGEEAQRLTRITEDLLRLTRLDSGAAAEPAPVAVAPVLRRVVRMLAVVAREQRISPWHRHPHRHRGYR
jgi:signal transduction histidine kinase